MLHMNDHAEHRLPLSDEDAALLGPDGLRAVEAFLSRRATHAPTPLVALPALAADCGVAAIHVKDEGQRLGLGSFKALGGAYAVVRLMLEAAGERLGRPLDIADLDLPEVRALAATMTFACATDGNHGRSVAEGARFVGASCVVFVHAGVSDGRVAAIAAYGARMVRVAGSYDDSIEEAARVSAREGWTTVSDTSWPGYERIPGLVMQGYTALVGEALRQLPEPPTHVFVQSGVGGIAAAVAGHLAVVLGESRPVFTVVDPARAACLYESALAGRPIRIPHGEPTVMAMLECCEPSHSAFRILTRAADAFMTVDEDDAVDVMRRLAFPSGRDPAIVAGESGGVGLAGLLRALADPQARAALGLDEAARVLVVNTEGATDPARYHELVGLDPQEVRGAP